MTGIFDLRQAGRLAIGLLDLTSLNEDDSERLDRTSGLGPEDYYGYRARDGLQVLHNEHHLDY